MKAVYKLNINIGNYAKGTELFPHNEGSLFGRKVMKPGEWGLNKDLIKVMVKNNLMIDLNPPKPKAKKLGKAAQAIADFCNGLLKEGVARVIFTRDYCFVYQYRINGCDVYCSFEDAKGKDLDIDNDYELGEILRKDIKNGYMDGSISGKRLIDIFKPYGITPMILEKGAKKPVEIKADDEFDVEGGSDS